jgi:hypothetical protein
LIVSSPSKGGSKTHLGSGTQKSLTRATPGMYVHRDGNGMKNTKLSRSTLNLAVVALLTLLFAGCAVAPEGENLSMGTTAAHTRVAFPYSLQPDPSDSPEFTQWGSKKDLLP